MSLLHTVLLMSLVAGTFATFPCAMFLDRDEITNLDLLYWRGQDSIFIDAHNGNWTDLQVRDAVIELLNKYTTVDTFRIYSQALGLDVTGPEQIVAAFNAIRKISKGERHVAPGSVVDCSNSNTYSISKDDLTVAKVNDGVKLYIGQKFTNITRTNILHPFKISAIEIAIQASYYLNDSNAPWLPQR